MPDTKLSNLTASSGLVDTDLFYEVTGASDFKCTAAQIRDFARAFAKGTITDPALLINDSVTWNDAADTFTAWKLDVTNTNSQLQSLLIDLQVGSASKFLVTRQGQGLFADRVLVGGSTVSYNIGLRDEWLALNSTGKIVWSFNSNAADVTDLTLRRAAAANLALGAADAAAPVAQTISVQSVVAGTSNTAGANFTISGSQGTGTGVGGSLLFKGALAGGAGSSQNTLTTMFSMVPAASGGQLNGPDGNGNFPTYSFASQINSGMYFNVASNMLLFAQGGGTALGIRSNSIILPSDVTFGWNGSVGNPLGSDIDTILQRDAAGVLAQRNGTNSQTFRQYGTYTDASNYERLSISMDPTSQGRIVTQSAGTGSPRKLLLGTDGSAAIEFLIGGSTKWSIDTSGNLIAVTGNFQEMLEMTAPTAGAANTVRIYADDNGAGKTRLMALFSSGAAQQIAIQP